MEVEQMINLRSWLKLNSYSALRITKAGGLQEIKMAYLDTGLTYLWTFVDSPIVITHQNSLQALLMNTNSYTM